MTGVRTAVLAGLTGLAGLGAGLGVGLGAGLGAGRRSAAAARAVAADDLAHDLRGPLGVILGEVELVLADGATPEDERRHGAALVAEMVGLVDRRLAAWRYANGRAS